MDLNKVSQFYDLGQVKEQKALFGRLHKTFLVVTENGKKYVFQKLNNTLLRKFGAANPIVIAEDWSNNWSKIFKALKNAPIQVSEPIAKDNQFCFEIDDSIWRVFKFIENDDETGDDKNAEINENKAHEAGKALGIFHSYLSKENLLPRFTIPNFHNTEYFLDKLDNVYNRDFENKASKVKEEFNFLLSETTKHFLPENLQKYLLHGDPKMANYLFKDGKVIALIDLDTVMLGSIFLDLGDAFRSWCKKDFIFQKNNFEAGLRGYSEGAKEKTNKDLALRATKLITLELATRYLIDYFEESYFNWDKEKFESSAEFNLFRAKKYIEYYKTINL